MLDNLREGSSSLYHQDPPKKSWPKSSSLAEIAAERTREQDSENVTGKHAACFPVDARILRYELSKVNWIPKFPPQSLFPSINQVTAARSMYCCNKLLDCQLPGSLPFAAEMDSSTSLCSSQNKMLKETVHIAVWESHPSAGSPSRFLTSWRRLAEMNLMGTVITCLAFQTWKKNHWDFSDKTALAEGQEIDLLH